MVQKINALPQETVNPEIWQVDSGTQQCPQTLRFYAVINEFVLHSSLISLQTKITPVAISSIYSKQDRYEEPTGKGSKEVTMMLDAQHQRRHKVEPQTSSTETQLSHCDLKVTVNFQVQNYYLGPIPWNSKVIQTY